MIDPNLYYLDPGTSSYIVQIIAAAGITVGIYFRSLKAFIINLKSKIFNKK